jgi:hypothetical protein
MAYPTGQYFMDGADLYLVYRVVLGPGSSDGFLRYPDRKEGTVNDWQDENGEEVDLSRVFLKSREVTLNCSFICENEAQFKECYTSFLVALVQPGQRRLEITELSKSYYVIYKGTPSFERVTRIKEGTFRGKIACKFTLTVKELQPKLDATNVHLVTQNGLFLIT